MTHHKKPDGHRRASSTTSFFTELGDVLRATGAQAERLAQMGVTKAEVEKVKLDLYRAQAALGRAVYRLWEETPGLAVERGEPRCAEALRRVEECESRVAALQQRMDELRADKPS